MNLEEMTLRALSGDALGTMLLIQEVGNKLMVDAMQTAVIYDPQTLDSLDTALTTFKTMIDAGELKGDDPTKIDFLLSLVRLFRSFNLAWQQAVDEHPAAKRWVEEVIERVASRGATDPA